MEKQEKLIVALSLILFAIIVSIFFILNDTGSNEDYYEDPYFGDCNYTYISENFEDSMYDEEESESIRHIVTATVYNPVVGQCDDTPLITADLSKIDLEKLNKGELRWIAVSRNLRKHYKYGSRVLLTFPDNPEMDGIYEVHDTMNIRYENYIDILSPETVTLGKWENVIIESIERD